METSWKVLSLKPRSWAAEVAPEFPMPPSLHQPESAVAYASQ
jgi:hypothetical protein